jgi:phosphopantothenoylcysteine decarboxylase/phosphopantothenate--cysteine ligase
MNCIVTAGPTYEPLDEVRRLTNFSSGRLGCTLANYLTAQGHTVTLLLGHYHTWQGDKKARSVVEFTTTADLQEQLKTLATSKVHAVFHAAAVSDFGFGKVWRKTPAGNLRRLKAGKLSTRTGVLMAELIPTPKILGQLRNWYPKALLVGWKFEVDGDRDSVVGKASTQISDCQTNLCVTNGPAYGKGFGVVFPSGQVIHAGASARLFSELNKAWQAAAKT